MLMISFRQMDNNNTKSINEKHPMFNEKQVKLRVSSNVNEGQNENKQFFFDYSERRNIHHNGNIKYI